MNARYYLLGIGRFISPDTLVPEPADPQSFNRYSYTLNNPLKYTDPTGRCVENYQYDSEYLGICVEGWSLLEQYYMDTYRDEHYPSEYLNEILMTYDIETIAGMLTSFGVEWNYSLPDRTPITEPPSDYRSNRDCYQHQGALVCSPEGGWPKYIPLTEDDIEYFRELGTSIALAPVGGLAGSPIKNRVAKWFVSQGVKSLLRPAAHCALWGCSSTDNQALTTDMNNSDTFRATDASNAPQPAQESERTQNPWWWIE